MKYLNIILSLILMTAIGVFIFKTEQSYELHSPESILGIEYFGIFDSSGSAKLEDIDTLRVYRGEVMVCVTPDKFPGAMTTCYEDGNYLFNIDRQTEKMLTVGYQGALSAHFIDTDGDKVFDEFEYEINNPDGYIERVKVRVDKDGYKISEKVE